MEKCVLCGKEFTSRSDFDRHACKEIVRPTRRPARWAFEVAFLTMALAGGFYAALNANWGGPAVVAAIFVLYTVLTFLSAWGLFKIQAQDVPEWTRYSSPLGQFYFMYGWRGGRLVVAGLLIVFWGALLTVWLGLYG